jgi:hypothetical protein
MVRDKWKHRGYRFQKRGIGARTVVGALDRIRSIDHGVRIRRKAAFRGEFKRRSQSGPTAGNVVVAGTGLEYRIIVLVKAVKRQRIGRVRQ